MSIKRFGIKNFLAGGFLAFAVILLVFSLSLGSLMAISPTVRAAVVRWVTEWYETHIIYRYSGEDILGEMPHYDISELPHGYTEIIRDVYAASVSVVYESSDGNVICFDYTHMQQGSAGIIVPGDDEIIDIKITLKGYVSMDADDHLAIRIHGFIKK